jgi:hypothetical protein
MPSHQEQGHLGGCPRCTLGGTFLKECIRQRTQWVDGVLGIANRSIAYVYGQEVRDIPDIGLRTCCRCAQQRMKEWMKSAVSSSRRVEDREGYRFSYVLLKKAMRIGCACLVEGLEDQFEANATRESGEVPDRLLRIIDDEIQRIFPNGWDRGYEAETFKHAPKSSGCVEVPRIGGGALAAATLDRQMAISSGLQNPGRPYCQFSIAPTSGKMRPLTITPVDMNGLRPLHKLIAKQLRRQKWLLTGPPTLEKVLKAGFRFRKGILSGDYKSATDNLNLRVSSYILGALLARCTTVPDCVKEYAIDSLCPIVTFRDREGERTRPDIEVTRGQMMGSLLSFPLLCLYNRVCALATLGRGTPMLINGDDLIAETSSAAKWFRELPRFGLEPEENKSGYSRDSFEINSTLFVRTKYGRWVRTNLLRCRSLAMEEDAIPDGAMLDSFLADSYGPHRIRAEKVWIDIHMPKIMKLIRSGVRLSALGFTRYSLARNRRLVAESKKWARFCPVETPRPVVVAEIHSDNCIPAEKMPYYGSCNFTSSYSSALLKMKSYGMRRVTPKRAARDAWQSLPRTKIFGVVPPRRDRLAARLPLRPPLSLLYGQPLRLKILRSIDYHTSPNPPSLVRKLIDADLKFLTRSDERVPHIPFVSGGWDVRPAGSCPGRTTWVGR